MDKPLLLKTLQGEYTERPPIWFMRQAGRVLPSYLALKEKYSFWQMMKDPALAAKVTLLPVEDLHVDAAILFSDILVIPYAMGMGLEFTDAGPEFDEALIQKADPVAALHPEPEKLQYIYNAIDKIIETKPESVPLIGFCGGPLTVLCYMLEGLSSKSGFANAVKFIYENKSTTKKLVDAIKELTIIYAQNQVKHGISAFQLFETHAGLIPFSLYKELFLPMVKDMASELRELNIPFIYFPKDAGTGIKEITPDYCDFLSIDWQTPIRTARELVHPGIGLQGNIDPRMLFGREQEIVAVLEDYLRFGSENQNWICNLGHGFIPGIPFEKIKFMTDWLRNADWQR
jgi:uroporphyrinogen decarboxylase